MVRIYFTLLFAFLCLSSCSEKSKTPSQRNFKMGFTSWPYDFTVEAVEDTYDFIEQNGDIYAEHIDNAIPWNELINGEDLPITFTDEIQGKINKRINQDLLLSVSLLNLSRTDLAEDLDGNIPSYNSLSNLHIENAYFDYLSYLVDAFSPDYLVMGIEVNILAKSVPTKWDQYKVLSANLRRRIKEKYPNLMLSESYTLHDWYGSNESPEITTQAQNLDFVAISFYPFMALQSTRSQFQEAFDFLHSQTDKKIAFVETTYITEDLTLPSFDLFIPANDSEQQVYLQTLFENAQEQDYLFVIWWTHRDYDRLMASFPPELIEIGSIWQNSGILDEDGDRRPSYSTWQEWYEKESK